MYTRYLYKWIIKKTKKKPGIPLHCNLIPLHEPVEGYGYWWGTAVCGRWGRTPFLYELSGSGMFMLSLLFLYLGVSLRSRPMGLYIWWLCIHLDSRLSLRCSAVGGFLIGCRSILKYRVLYHRWPGVVEYRSAYPYLCVFWGMLLDMDMGLHLIRPTCWCPHLVHS